MNRQFAQHNFSGGTQQISGPQSPYAFVPFAASEPERSDIDAFYQNERELLTGWMDIRGYVKTRLALPDAAAEQIQQDEHRIMSFFRLPDGQPAIPGSELRGLLRSVYETASNSCVPFLLDDSRPISMRMPASAAIKNRGLLMLKEGHWQLWSAYDRCFRAGVNDQSAFQNGVYMGYHTGDRVSFIPGNQDGAILTDPDHPEAETGWIQFSSPVVWPKMDFRTGKQNYYHVHILQEKECIHTWEEDFPYTSLVQILDRTEDGARKTMRDGAEKVHRSLLEHLRSIRATGEGALPVFYVDAKDKKGNVYYYLSPSSIGRVGQVRKWPDILGPYCTCTERKRLCPACRLFGIINGSLVIRSRVRVSDARFTGSPVMRSVTLPVLGGPKPTAFEYYIRQPKKTASFWNYDFYSETGERRNASYTYREDFSPLGRKYYWHHQDYPEPAAPGKLNITTEYIEPGAEFTFSVFFDRVTETQLRQLQWVITLGENSAESPLRQKLGHAKPFGYGSVKLVIEKTAVRRLFLAGDRISYRMEYPPVPGTESCPFPERFRQTLSDLLTVCDSSAGLKYDPDYPRAESKDGPKIYAWFARNRVLNRSHPVPSVLPPISEYSTQPRKAEFTPDTKATTEEPKAGIVDRSGGSGLTVKVGTMPYRTSMEGYQGKTPRRGDRVLIQETGLLQAKLLKILP